MWGMPKEMLSTAPGYTGDVTRNREEARAIMRHLGYGPDKRIPFKLSVRNLNVYRDPGTILIDQLREIYFDGELELTETATWVPKLIKKDYSVGVSVLGAAADDPDAVLLQNHVCSSVRNYTGHCDPELDKKMEAQSREIDPSRRRQMVWEIDQKLQEQLARPILYHRKGGTCWQPWVKGLTLMVNSQYNGWRMEDVWLDGQQ
jgi:peptide/nickel transport system substrate-binding protein